MGIYLVEIKITVFWKVMPQNLADRYQMFGRIWCLHLQGRRAIQLNCFLLYASFFGIQKKTPISWYLSTKLRNVTSQKTKSCTYMTIGTTTLLFDPSWFIVTEW